MSEVHKITYRGYVIAISAMIMNRQADRATWRYIPMANAVRADDPEAKQEDMLVDMGTIAPFGTEEECYEHAEAMAKRHVDKLATKK